MAYSIKQRIEALKIAAFEAQASRYQYINRAADVLAEMIAELEKQKAEMEAVLETEES